MWTPMFWMVAVAVAGAGPWDAVLRAEDLQHSGRPEEAVASVAGLLSADPADLGAQYVHVSARTLGLRDGAAVERQYRTWLERDRGAYPARFGLAAAVALAAIGGPPGEWCHEVESLIGGPVPARQAVWTLRLRIEARSHCGIDIAGDLAALKALGATEDLALAWSIREQIRDGEVSEADAADYERLLARAPALSGEVGSVFIAGVGGPGARPMARAQLGAQRRLVHHEDPRVVAFAATILSLANDPAAGAALDQLARVDPGRSWTHPTSEGLVRWYLRDLPRRAEPEARALQRRLEVALDPRSGEVGEAAVRELRAIWERDPRDTDAAHAFARAASARGLYEGVAVAALDYAIKSAPAWDPRGVSRAGSYDGWRREAAAEMGGWLAERGWLRHRTGYPAQGAGDLRAALLIHPAPSADIHLRLGLIYYRLGHEQDALFQLALGLAAEEGGEAYRDDARLAAEVLYAQQAWAPGGLDDWIAAQAAARGGPGAE